MEDFKYCNFKEITKSMFANLSLAFQESCCLFPIAPVVSSIQTPIGQGEVSSTSRPAGRPQTFTKAFTQCDGFNRPI